MKPIRIFILSAVISCSLTSSPYAQSFREGANVASVGIGLGGSLLSSGAYSSSTPAISLQYEHGQWEVGGPGTISLGGYVGFKSYKYSYGTYDLNGQPYSFEGKWSYTIIGIRSAWHYNGLSEEKFDPYGGLMLSYNILKYSNNYRGYGDYSYTGSSGLGLTLYVGGRYYFTNNVAVFAELGYGIAYLNLGVSLKF